MSHRYTLTLDAGEVATIRFVASRGYAMAVWDAITSDATVARHDREYAVFHIPEHLAWAVADEERDNGGHGFGPVSAELTAKLYAFVDGIV